MGWLTVVSRGDSMGWLTVVSRGDSMGWLTVVSRVTNFITFKRSFVLKEHFFFVPTLTSYYRFDYLLLKNRFYHIELPTLNSTSIHRSVYIFVLL
jgi:hypothetical protein